MKYSVIVAVYNRLDEVKELLVSAERLEFDRSLFELFFVDDGSTDGFKEFVNGYKSATGLNIQAIYQQNKGPGAARNNGMANAKGEYFVFVDSDCTFPPHWLKEIDTVANAQHLDAFGGPDTFHPSFPPLLKAINYSMTSLIGTGGTRGNKKSVGKFYPRSFNMGIHRKIYENIGGMNALRHGQDMDFSARIYKAGYKVGLIPNAFVYHKRRTSLAKFFRQIFNWGVARINLANTHKELLKPVHFLPLIVVLVGVFALISSVVLAGPSLFIGLLLMYKLLLVFAFVESFVKYKSVKTSFLSVITLNLQVLAYALGFGWALIQKLIGKQEAKGFVKNYYGKSKT